MPRDATSEPRPEWDGVPTFDPGCSEPEGLDLVVVYAIGIAGYLAVAMLVALPFVVGMVIQKYWPLF